MSIAPTYRVRKWCRGRAERGSIKDEMHAEGKMDDLSDVGCPGGGDTGARRGGVGPARRDDRLPFRYRPEPRLWPAAAGRETWEGQPGPVVRYAEAGDQAGVPGPRPGRLRTSQGRGPTSRRRRKKTYLLSGPRRR